MDRLYNRIVGYHITPCSRLLPLYIILQALHSVHVDRKLFGWSESSTADFLEDP